MNVNCELWKEMRIYLRRFLGRGLKMQVVLTLPLKYILPRH